VSDGRDRDRLGAAGEAFVREHLDPSRNVARLDALLSEVVAARRSTRRAEVTP
jgi:hypothetical protein